MPFYLTPEQDDYNKIPELQVCIAEAGGHTRKWLRAVVHDEGLLWVGSGRSDRPLTAKRRMMNNSISRVFTTMEENHG
jgi:hypothetical protein